MALHIGIANIETDNSKTGIPTISTTAVETCKNCANCEKACYARKCEKLYPAVKAQEPTQEETEAAAQAELSEAREELHRIASTRSAWARGVLAYADELLDSLSETIAWEHEAPANAKLLLKALLNGAADWEMYSFGGCSLVYDRDIAERLCTPSELRKTDHGRKLPNQRETWLAVQARALYQASALVREAYRITRARKEVA